MSADQTPTDCMIRSAAGHVKGTTFAGHDAGHDDAVLTLEPTGPGQSVVEMWTCIGGDESCALRLSADTARAMAHDLLLRADVADEGDDDGHGPWFYLEGGVLCSCRNSVDANERCTRPRGPRAKFDARMAALFETADALLEHASREGVLVGFATHLDDLRAARDALTGPADED